MRRAPAVNFPIAKSRWHLRSIVTLALLAVAVACAFVYDQPPLGARTGVLACALLLTSAVAFMVWQKSPMGSLRWDGQVWHWSGFGATTACRLSLLLDFQSVMLVSLKGSGATRPVWLWLEAVPKDPSWAALRRAIVSSRGLAGSGSPVDTLDRKEDVA